MHSSCFILILHVSCWSTATSLSLQQPFSSNSELHDLQWAQAGLEAGFDGCVALEPGAIMRNTTSIQGCSSNTACSNIIFNEPGIPDYEQLDTRKPLPPVQCTPLGETRTQPMLQARVSVKKRILVLQPRWLDSYGEFMTRIPEIARMTSNGTWDIFIPFGGRNPMHFWFSLLAPFGKVIKNLNSTIGRSYLRGGGMCCLQHRHGAELRSSGAIDAYLAHYEKTHVAPERGRTLFVGRRGSRQIANQQELIHVCNAAGLSCHEIFFDDMPFAQMLQSVRTSNYMVGRHGAGMINGVFMQQGVGKVIEVWSHSSYNQGYMTLPGAFGVALMGAGILHRTLSAPEFPSEGYACPGSPLLEVRHNCNVTLSWDAVKNAIEH